LHYYVGPAPHTEQGILLYNRKTKLVIIRRSYQKLDPVIPHIPVVVSDPTMNSSPSLIDNNIMPEPYFSEQIINKNHAALPVHIQEIDQNNSPNKNNNPNPSPSLKRLQQSPKHISHHISPSLVDQRRSPRLAQLGRTNRFSCFSADLEDQESYNNPIPINDVSIAESPSIPASNISEDTAIVDMSINSSPPALPVHHLSTNSYPTTHSSINEALPPPPTLSTPVSSPLSTPCVSNSILSAPNSTFSKTHQSVNKIDTFSFYNHTISLFLQKNNILLGIAESENLEISTMDVKIAFILPIKETIYLK